MRRRTSRRLDSLVPALSSLSFPSSFPLLALGSDGGLLLLDGRLGLERSGSVA